MSCPCDTRVFPLPLAIPAGLDALPRRIASFAEFREAMLASIPLQPALRPWNGRARDDFGLMLLEMWAYVCDVGAFYDEVLADEAYLRTAQELPSLRRLTGLLGYVPRPAIASAVRLAMLIDGRRPVVVPAGTAIRSGGFDSEPPQVFETDRDTLCDPSANQWTVTPPRANTLNGRVSSLFLAAASAKVKAGRPLVIGSEARWVTNVTPVVGSDGAKYVRVDLDIALQFDHPVPMSEIKLRMPMQKGGLWSQPLQKSNNNLDLVSDLGVLLLDGLYRQINVGDFVVLNLDQYYLAAQVSGRTEPPVTVTAEHTVTITPDDTSIKPSSVVVPALTVLTTQLALSVGLNGSAWADPSRFILHYGCVDAGTLTAAAETVLGPSDTMALAGVHVGPAGPPSPNRFFLTSADERSIEASGSVDFATPALALDPNTTFDPALELPVKVYANLVDATRGERVPHEVLGNGDAPQANQSFTLKKKPLTYVPAPAVGNEWGAVSTLTVWVDGVQWSEAPSFFAAGPTDSVFIVRQTDDAQSVVTFGDGLHGARLPTGVGNVVATYRFGAGAASPPASSIQQIATPIVGLKSVANPVAADGGEDAEGPEALRIQAPRSALLLGRIVSIQDFEVAAASVGGVRVARAEWRWQPERQRPVVLVTYIGGDGLEPLVSRRLRALSDPSTPIHVEQARPRPSRLAVDIETDPRRIVADVVAAVQAALLADGTGFLEPEQLGIGQPLFRSRLFEQVLAVPGAIGVRSLSLNHAPFSAYGKDPGSGHYFDFESGKVHVSGSPRTDG